MSAERPYDVWIHLAQMNEKARRMRKEGKSVREVTEWREEKYRNIVTGALSGHPFEESFTPNTPKNPTPICPLEKVAA